MRQLAASLVASLLVAACGPGAGALATPSPAAQTAHTPAPDPLASLPAELPLASDPEPAPGSPEERLRSELFLRVVSSSSMGGGSKFARVPEVSIYADGTVILPRVVPSDNTPGLPPVVTVRLSNAGLERVRQKAAEVGLLSATELHLPSPGLHDGSITRFVALVAAARHTVSVNNINSKPVSGVAPEPDVPDLQSKRQAFASFAAWLRGIPSWTDLARPPAQLAVTKLAVFATIVDSGGPPTPSTWSLPLGEIIPGRGAAHCAIFRGAELTRALDAIKADTDDPPYWNLPDNTHAVLAFRPLLPDEATCDDLQTTVFGPQPKEPDGSGAP